MRYPAVPARRFGLFVLMVSLVWSLGVVAAHAEQPPTAPASVVSANFDFGAAPMSVDDIVTGYPVLAYWGPIANVRRGTSGQSLWCAGTRQYPSLLNPSGFFPTYPYWGQLVQQSAEPHLLVSITPQRLTYQSASGLVVKSPTGKVYSSSTDYVVGTDTQGYTTIAKRTTSTIPVGETVSIDYQWPSSGTRGVANLDLSALADYYRSWVSLYYLMPSRGAADANSLSLHWYDNAAPNDRDVHYGYPLAAAWAPLGYELSAGQTVSLSRRPGTLGIQFYDQTEAAGAIRNGQGAAIDDVSVTGFKYGPVRSLAAGLSNQTVQLSWSKPAKTPTDATADERTLTYRVWRRVAGDSTWTELTTSRLASPAFNDSNVPQGRSWDYAVQAWDTATGAGYGELAQLSGVVGPADTTKPVITVSGVSGGASYKTSKTVTFSATDNVGVTSNSATLNGAPFASGQTISAQGSYSLVVTASDAAGNTSTSTVSFTIDLTAPSITVTGVSNGASYKTSKTVTFSATDNMSTPTATATLDGAPFTSGTTVSGQGVHTLVVTATDVAGNAASDTYTFTLDTTAPVISISGVANGASYGATVTPEFSAIDNIQLAQLSATLGGVPFVSGTSVAADGDYTLVVNATDAAGNTAQRTIDFTVNTAAPVIVVTGVENERSYNTTVTPVFSATHPLGLSGPASATLNSAPFTSGTPKGAEGAYELVVTATSSTGVTATQRVSFVIDKTPPSIGLTGVSHNGFYKTSVTPTFSDSDNFGVVSRTAFLDGVPFVSGTTIHAEGTYELVLTATDAAGNTRVRATTFTVDKTLPTISTGGFANGSYYKGAVTPTFSDSDNVGVVARSATLNGKSFASGTSVTAEGTHELALTATDAAGNTRQSTSTFTIDLTQPNIDVAGVAHEGFYNTEVVPVISHSDNYGVVSRTATLNGQPFASETPVSAQGTYELVLSATDAAGNTRERTITFTIDLAPPTASHVFDFSNGNTAVTLSGVDTGGSGVSSVGYRVDDGSEIVAAGSTAAFDVAGFGSHRLEYRAFDRAGNSSIPTIVIIKRPTVLSFSAPSTSDYASARLTGYLKADGKGVSGRTVEIQQLVSGTWKKIGTTAPTSSSGFFAYTAKPTAKATYRAVFREDDTYKADDSASDTVLPRVRLTRSTSWGTLYRNRTYYAKGYIEPYHASSNANKVTIRAYKRASNGKYYYVKSFTASYSKYSSSKSYYTAKVTLTSTGSWKLIAYHKADSTNAATYGSADYVTVR